MAITVSDIARAQRVRIGVNLAQLCEITLIAAGSVAGLAFLYKTEPELTFYGALVALGVTGYERFFAQQFRENPDSFDRYRRDPILG